MGFRHNTNVTTAQMFREMREFLTTEAGLINIGQASVGTGTLIDYAATKDSVEETLQLVATTVGPSATFTVAGGVSGAHPDATSGVPYALVDGSVSFTIEDGTTPWSIGDSITLEVKHFMGADTPWSSKSQVEERQYVNSIQSSRGLEYISDNDGMLIVEGRYPDTLGIKFNGPNASATRQDVTQYAGNYPEMIEGNGYPRQFALSFWADETQAFPQSYWYIATGDRHTVGSYTSSTSYYQLPAALPYQFIEGLMTATTDAFGPQIQFAGGGIVDRGVTYLSGYRLAASGDMLSYRTMYNARLTSSAYPWNLYCVNIDAVNPACEFFVNGVSTGRRNVSTATTSKWPSIYRIGHLNNASRGLVFDELVVWDGLFDETSATELYNRSSKVDTSTTLTGGIHVWEKVTDNVLTDTGAGNFSNVAPNGQVINLKFGVTSQAIHLSAAMLQTSEPYKTENQHTMFYSYAYPYNNSQGNLITASWLFSTQSNTSLYNYAQPERPSYLVKDITHLIRGLEEQVEAYWIVADTSRIIIVTKYYDATTTRKTPLYQVSYIGQIESAGGTGPLLVIAGSYTGSADWTTNSTALRFGALYSSSTYTRRTEYSGSNLTFYDLNNFLAFRWEHSWTYYNFLIDYGKNHADIYPYDNYFPTWDLILGGPAENNLTDADPDTTGDWAQNFGRFKGIVSLCPNNINAGDLLSINGDDYIVIQDGNRTDAASILGIKLA